MKPTKWNILLAFFAIYVIWGSTYLAIVFAETTIPPFLMAGTRFFLSGAALYIFARCSASKPSREHWRSALLVGTLLCVGGNGGVVWAVQVVPTAVAALLIATVPFWMVLLEAFQMKRKLSTGVCAGLCIGFAGVWMLVGPGASRFHPLGVLILLAAAFSWSIGSLYSRRLPMPVSSFLGVGMQMLCGGLGLLAISFFSGEFSRFDPEAVSTGSALALAYLIFFGSFIGFTAYLWLLKVSTVSRVSTYAYVNPVVAVFLGWFCAGEKLTALTLGAAAVILASVILIQKASPRGTLA